MSFRKIGNKWINTSKIKQINIAKRKNNWMVTVHGISDIKMKGWSIYGCGYANAKELPVSWSFDSEERCIEFVNNHLLDD